MGSLKKEKRIKLLKEPLKADNVKRFFKKRKDGGEMGGDSKKEQGISFDRFIRKITR